MLEGLFQPSHIFFILVIVLILFGPGKLPELGKGLGKGIREFKDAMRGVVSSSDASEAEDEKKAEVKTEEKKQA
ncbi:MAG: twin-arginine translocase TatA/TatE family subunit [Acidobacteria bacterium]|nr:twin-arginine translocase TatA/TatE family subunit [Acidobacteriota bacterium]